MAENYGTLLPATGDGQRVLLGKIVRSLTGGSGGLLTNEVVSGAGAPTHTPTIPTQLYIDTNTGTIWEWYSGGPWK